MTDFAARRTMMVDTQIRPSDVTKFPIIEAMLTVPREDFVPVSQREAAYVGETLHVAPQRVLLEPRTLAKMLDALNIGGDALVLDVGAGLGYSSAVIARMAAAVVAVEEDEAMADEAQDALMTTGADNVIVHKGRLTEGAAQHGPYDIIIVQGAVETVPDVLIDQLKDDGRIACLFSEGPLGDVRVGVKSNGKVTWRSEFNAGAPVLPGFAKPQGFTL